MNLHRISLQMHFYCKCTVDAICTCLWATKLTTWIIGMTHRLLTHSVSTHNLTFGFGSNMKIIWLLLLRKRIWCRFESYSVFCIFFFKCRIWTAICWELLSKTWIRRSHCGQRRNWKVKVLLSLAARVNIAAVGTTETHTVRQMLKKPEYQKEFKV